MGTVSIKLETDSKFAAISKALEREAPKRVYRKIARSITPFYERLLDRTLRQEPPERNSFSPPFIWSHDPTKQARARRWFFAHYPNGYRRTHTMSKAWEVAITLNDGGLTFDIGNPTPGASYVYGTAEFGQVPGHVTTGWQRAVETLADIGGETIDAIGDLWQETIDEIVGV